MKVYSREYDPKDPTDKEAACIGEVDSLVYREPIASEEDPDFSWGLSEGLLPRTDFELILQNWRPKT